MAFNCLVIQHHLRNPNMKPYPFSFPNICPLPIFLAWHSEQAKMERRAVIHRKEHLSCKKKKKKAKQTKGL